MPQQPKNAIECKSALENAVEENENTEEHKTYLSELTEAAKRESEHASAPPGTSAKTYHEDIQCYLKDALFVGHVNTDLDSVAGAIGAAVLFGGVATVSEKGLNGEILYALECAGLKPPPFIEDVKGALRGSLPGKKERKICLVDHSEVKLLVWDRADHFVPQKSRHQDAVGETFRRDHTFCQTTIPLIHRLELLTHKHVARVTKSQPNFCVTRIKPHPVTPGEADDAVVEERPSLVRASDRRHRSSCFSRVLSDLKTFIHGPPAVGEHELHRRRAVPAT